jgi:hypothetical protein
LQRVVQQANSVRIAGQLKTMATADVAAAGWDRERIASQLQPLLVLWQTATSGNSALKAVSHGVSKSCLLEQADLLSLVAAATMRLSLSVCVMQPITSGVD